MRSMSLVVDLIDLVTKHKSGELRCPATALISFQFRKNHIPRYRRKGYNLNVMRQSACLVFNPIRVDRVDNYAAFFNCTPVGRASDSMMAQT